MTLMNLRWDSSFVIKEFSYDGVPSLMLGHDFSLYVDLTPTMCSFDVNFDETVVTT